MKVFKFIWMILGLAWLVALFLPYGGDVSLWELGQLAQDSGSTKGLAIVVGVLALVLAWLGLTTTAIRKRLSRPIALAGAAIVLGYLVLLFSMGSPGGEMGIGARLLIQGGLVGFLAAIIPLIRPERVSPAF